MHFDAAEFHPVFILALGFGLLTPTLIEFIEAQSLSSQNENRSDSS